MKLQDIVNSRFSIAAGIWIGQTMPTKLGYFIGRRIAKRVAKRRTSEQVQAVRANQWVIHGGNLTSQELDRKVEAVFLNQSKSLFDFYHNWHSFKRISKLISYTPEFERFFEEATSGKQGVVMVGPHISCFDLCGMAISHRGLKMQVLSIANPNGSYQWQNEMRERQGLEMTPASIESLLKAARRLRSGGAILTGVDRPMPDPKHFPTFFRRPSVVPVSHVQLALKVGVPIYVLYGIRQPNDRYVVTVEGPIYMEKFDDPETEVLKNAEKVLEVVEGILKKYPEQWSMFYPVWPEALDEVPSTLD
jgi:KDO2-lipid IV(A) lauroyltransferase